MSNPVEMNDSQKELIKQLIRERIADCEFNIKHLITQRKIKEEKGQLDRATQYSEDIDNEIQLRIDLITLKGLLK